MVYKSNTLKDAFLSKNSHQKNISKVAFNFISTRCNTNYFGQSDSYSASRTDDHFDNDKKLRLYQRKVSYADCLDKCANDCFSLLDTANTKHQL